MKFFSSIREDHLEEFQENDRSAARPQSVRDRMFTAVYALALALSIWVWFIAVRAPLWVDETATYWQIKAGFWGIWPRQFLTLSSPEYGYVLWLSAKLFGTSEIALRTPSILAMLGAAYLLYRAARELFSRDCAILAAIIFCLDPIVVFAAIDVRPYAFAALATNATIFILFLLRRNGTNWLAALFGLSAACIIWFHFLFVVFLPALVLCFFVLKIGDRKTAWRQFSVALAVFALAFLPVIPLMMSALHNVHSHVSEPAPTLGRLAWTLAPGWLLPCLCGTGFAAFLVSAAARPRESKKQYKDRPILLCVSLAFIPVFILYGVSAVTSIHLTPSRYLLIAVPGISLCWAMLVDAFHPRSIRLLFCVAFVMITACFYFRFPLSRRDLASYKFALEAAEQSASADDAPVLICSDFIESNYVEMPVDSAKESKFFAPLSYYKLSVPVVPLPMDLNEEAIRVSSRFLKEAASKHERFLAVAYRSSYRTLDWLTQSASATYSVRELGIFDDVKVLEFIPRAAAVPHRD
ncbi:MAG: glycosyltransferase family 39 protein [Terracidiphilus sp.]